MIEVDRIKEELSSGPGFDTELDENPTKEDVREEVRRFKEQGKCGRQIGQHHLGPYLIVSDTHGQREIDLLEQVLNEEFEDMDVCIHKRQRKCSIFKGGCKGVN